MQDLQETNLNINLSLVEKYPIINNQTGSITLFNLLIVLTITFICLSTVINKIKIIQRSNQISKNYLCMKEYTGELKQHRFVLERANKIIKLSNTGQIVGIFTNPSIAITAQKVKKAAQLAQKTYHFSFLKNLALLFKKGCVFSPSSTKTNFQSKSVLKLQRDNFGLVKRRKKGWSTYSIGTQNILKASFSKNQVEVEESLGAQVARGISSFAQRFL